MLYLILKHGEQEGDWVRSVLPFSVIPQPPAYSVGNTR